MLPKNNIHKIIKAFGINYKHRLSDADPPGMGRSAGPRGASPTLAVQRSVSEVQGRKGQNTSPPSLFGVSRWHRRGGYLAPCALCLGCCCCRCFFTFFLSVWILCLPLRMETSVKMCTDTRWVLVRGSFGQLHQHQQQVGLRGQLRHTHLPTCRGAAGVSQTTTDVLGFLSLVCVFINLLDSNKN